MSTSWINPVLLQLGPIAIHWYGLMYALTFLFAYFFLKHSRLGKKLPLSDNQKDNLLISIILGIILGGRLGYIIFYNLPYYLQNPAKTLSLWEGGLSFHGGLIGALIAILLYLHFYRRRQRRLLMRKETGEIMTVSKEKPSTSLPRPISFLQITDIAALIAPIGIFLGRIGNFINAELYGRISPDNQLCLYFPTDPGNCRYPSQLFQSIGEGLLIFIVLYTLTHFTKITDRPGRLGALFLTLYGLIRTLIEYTREPDPQIGYLLGGPGFLQGLTLGQLLSLITMAFGIILLLKFSKKDRS